MRMSATIGIGMTISTMLIPIKEMRTLLLVLTHFLPQPRYDTSWCESVPLPQPCLLLRTSYPDDAGTLRMLMHANLDGSIEEKGLRTLCLFQHDNQSVIRSDKPTSNCICHSAMSRIVRRTPPYWSPQRTSLNTCTRFLPISSHLL